jgi:glucosamine--fructose-6-phosphate aminotransferase (isomerizing)
MSLFSEINEQPERLKSLLSSQRKTVEKIASEICKHDIAFVFLAARGTSDNAARYANYLWGALNRLPTALATPSLFTYYQKPPRLKNALIVGISQSGQSPDILSVLEEGKRQNCLTLAITNETDSPLANVSDFVLDIQAGAELAVAATKTYTSELMAIAMLSVAMGEDKSQWRVLGRVGAWAKEVLKQDKQIEQLAQRYRYMRQCVVLGRGYNYSTAFEWALKLKELTYVVAEPYSSADFQHGPIAMIENSFPVLAINPEGSVFETMQRALAHIRNDFGAELVIISNNQSALDIAQTPLVIPQEIPEWLTPLVSIIPAQLFAYHLTLAKGFDTERPRSIRKVTETR